MKATSKVSASHRHPCGPSARSIRWLAKRSDAVDGFGQGAFVADAASWFSPRGFGGTNALTILDKIRRKILIKIRPKTLIKIRPGATTSNRLATSGSFRSDPHFYCRCRHQEKSMSAWSGDSSYARRFGIHSDSFFGNPEYIRIQVRPSRPFPGRTRGRGRRASGSRAPRRPFGDRVLAPLPSHPPP